MKKLIITLFAVGLISTMTNAQTAQYGEMYGDVIQNCKWNEVTIVDSLVGEQGIIYRVVGSEVVKKSDGKKQLSDFTDKEIESIKKSATKLHTCTILFENNYQTPAALKNVDLAAEAEKKNYIYFYFMMPTKKIE